MQNKTVTCVDIDGNEHKVPVGELQWRPSVYGIVIKDASILLSRQFGGYDLPGGGIDLGETIEDAVIRETSEETGIIVKNPQPLSAASSLFKLPGSDKDVFIQSILLYYTCEFVGGELSVDGFDEDEQKYAELAEWVPLDDLDKLKVASSVDWRPIVRKVLGSL